MKIALIAPGLISIPPTGWGAIETLVYDYSIELERQGLEVLIVNDPDKSRALETIHSFSPDIVHCHADNLVGILKEISCEVKAFTSHFGYLETPHRFPRYIEETHKQILAQEDAYIFCLSPAIAAMYLRDRVDASRLRITANGVDTKLFHFSDSPSHGDKSIYLAQISARKRQYLAQNLKTKIDFVGGLTSYHDAYRAGFNPTKRGYIGEWSRAELHQKLTNYGNLVLLSDAEAHPLVCLEALSAGLGVVVSEASAANLDTNLPFITVIPENRIHDSVYVGKEITENRYRSVKARQAIHEYAQFFNYENTVSRYKSMLLEIVDGSKTNVHAINSNILKIQPPATQTRHKPRRFLPGLTSKAVIAYWKVKAQIIRLITLRSR